MLVDTRDYLGAKFFLLLILVVTCVLFLLSRLFLCTAIALCASYFALILNSWSIKLLVILKKIKNPCSESTITLNCLYSPLLHCLLRSQSIFFLLLVKTFKNTPATNPDFNGIHIFPSVRLHSIYRSPCSSPSHSWTNLLHKEEKLLPGPALVLPFIGDAIPLVKNPTKFWDKQSALAQSTPLGISTN